MQNNGTTTGAAPMTTTNAPRPMPAGGHCDGTKDGRPCGRAIPAHAFEDARSKGKTSIKCSGPTGCGSRYLVPPHAIEVRPAGDSGKIAGQLAAMFVPPVPVGSAPGVQLARLVEETKPAPVAPIVPPAEVARAVLVDSPALVSPSGDEGIEEDGRTSSEPTPAALVAVKARPVAPLPSDGGVIAARSAEVETGDEDILGAFAWYSFPECELPTDDVLDLWTRAGLDAKNLQGIRTAGALGRGCRHVPHDGYQVLKSASDDTRVVYAFTSKTGEKDANGDDIRRDVQVVTYDRAAGLAQSALGKAGNPSLALTFSTDWQRAEIAAAFVKYTSTMTPDKLGGSVRKALDAVRAVRLRPTGGFYFVPASQLDIIPKLRDFAAKLAALGKAANVGRSYLTGAGSKGAENREEVRIGASEHILADLALKEAKLAEMLAEAKEGKKLRASTWIARRKEVIVLREKARSYAELVQLDVATIEERLAAIVASCEAAGEVAVPDDESDGEAGEE